MADYAEQANAIAKSLSAAGYAAEYVESLDTVKVIIGDEYWYVDTMDIKIPDSALIKSELKIYADEDAVTIDLYYENGRNIQHELRQSKIIIRGKKFHRQEYHIYIGYLRGGVYIGLLDKWIGPRVWAVLRYFEEFPYESVMPPIDILELDFTPATPSKINIQNKGQKLIRRNDIVKSNINCFTAFVYNGTSIGGNGIDYIATGKYTDSGRDDLFKFVNENGELFALLTDPQTGVTNLASATKNIKLTCLEDCIVHKVDDLYNGYELDEASAALLKKHQDYIYCYDYTYFTVIPDKTCEFDSVIIVELAARKPNSGAKTKAAVATAIAE